MGDGSCEERLKQCPSPPQQDTFFEDVEEATRKTIEREAKHRNYQATASQVRLLK